MIKKFTIELDQEKKTITKNYGEFTKIELLGLLEIEKNNILNGISVDQNKERMKKMFKDPEFKQMIENLSKQIATKYEDENNA
jgi:hypothetical protein